MTRTPASEHPDDQQHGRDGGDAPPYDGHHGDAADDAAVVAGLREEVARLEDRWLRAAADLDNLRKRAEREARRIRAEERATVAAAWLPVLDNLELALQHASSDPAAIIEGVRSVRDQAVAVLTRLGFPPRDDEGATFDPLRHEVISTMPDPDAAPGTILHVVRPGYGDGDRQLRPAAVIVASRAQ